MGNAGEARLDVVAMARDEVSVVMNKISGELDQMKAKLAGYEKAQRGTGAAATDAAKATGSLVTQMTSLKGQAAGVNKVREAFENLRSNFFFVVAGAAGVVASVAAIAQALNTNNVAIAQWEAVSKSVNPAIESTKDAVRALREELGELAPRTNLEQILGGLEKQLLGLTDKLEMARGGVVALEGQLDIIGAYDYTGLATLLGAVESIENQRNDALTKALNLTETLTDATNRYVAALKRIPTDANTFVGPSPDANPNDANTFVGPRPNFAPDKPKGGGGGGNNRQRYRDAMNGVPMLVTPDGQMIEIDDLPASFFGPDPRTADDLEGRSGGGRGASSESPMKRQATDAEMLAEALTNVARATEMVNEAMPGYAAILSDISDITGQVIDKKMSLNDALVAGSASILANSAKAIGGVKAEAAVRAIYELYMGFATLGTPPISAGHFIAAAGLGALAGGAGIGGGKGSGTGGGRAANTNTGSQGGGTTTVVNNFSMGIGDRQTIRQSLRLSERSSRGTGADTRAAV